MMNKKNLSIIGIAVAVLAALGVLVYRNNHGVKKVEQATLETPTTVSGVTMTGSGKVETVPLGSAKLPPAPTLERSTDFANTLPPEAKTIVLAHIEANVKALQKNPQDIDAWTDLGINRKMLGDYEGARDAWEYAKALNQANIIPWNNLGDLYHYHLKDYVKSELNWKKTIALKPDYIAGYRGLYELYAYSYKEKADQAPVILKEGIAKNPTATDLKALLDEYEKTTVK